MRPRNGTALMSVGAGMAVAAAVLFIERHSPGGGPRLLSLGEVSPERVVFAGILGLIAGLLWFIDFRRR
jgi:hypothetical protein